jgi:hypothetical protein
MYGLLATFYSSSRMPFRDAFGEETTRRNSIQSHANTSQGRILLQTVAEGPKVSFQCIDDEDPEEYFMLGILKIPDKNATVLTTFSN